ncbi:hypothetical protein [Anaerovorax odorimutans]|uniref:hypothetical protein n=1 Tax=Anaerovorax odorimutans TaxID=109327 RepID=UPI000407DA7B|nr:hypothetical protein [Anaerovorax odorimutans]
MAGTIAGSLIFDTSVNTDGFERGTNSVENETERMSNSFDKLSKAVIAAFSINAIKNFGQKIIETTASLQAMDAQFEQVFKGSEGGAALKAINEQSEELGIHVDRLKSSFSQFGAQTKGVGMDATTALEATTTATKNAADAAAFYDVSLETATASISSLMKGNFEAGESIGVFTSATQLSARAVKEYGKSWDKLTEAEKQWLILDKISEVYELNGAVDQSIREQDNWITVTGNLAAEWNRFLEIVGAPILEGVVSIVQSLTEVLGGLIEVMQRDPETTKTFINIILGFLAGLTTYLVGKNITGMVQGLSTAFTTFGKALGSPIGRIAIAAAVLLILVQMLERLINAWGNMSGVEKAVAVLAALTIAATSAAIAVGALQSAWSLGIAAVAIIAGIVAMTAAIKSAEAKAKTSTPSGSNYSSQYSSAIPKLATGTVIPPNSEFLAILGDQKSGTNIEAPLSTIKQGVREVMQESGGVNSGGDIVLNATVNLDGEVIYNNQQRISRRRGTRLINGVT